MYSAMIFTKTGKQTKITDLQTIRHQSVDGGTILATKVEDFYLRTHGQYLFVGKNELLAIAAADVEYISFGNE